MHTAIHLQALVNSDRATAHPQASCCRGPTAVAPTLRLPTCLGLCSAQRVETSFSQWRHPPSESHRAAWPRLLEGPLSQLNCRCSFATTILITNTKTHSFTRTCQPRPLRPQTILTTPTWTPNNLNHTPILTIHQPLLNHHTDPLQVPHSDSHWGSVGCVPLPQRNADGTNRRSCRRGELRHSAHSAQRDIRW
jgi:hypothetical protein